MFKDGKVMDTNENSQIAKDFFLRNYFRWAIVLLCFVIWMVVESYFIEDMINVSDAMSKYFSRIWYDVLVSGVFLVWTVCLLYRHIKYDHFPSKNVVAGLILFCSIYAYYRFFDNHFVFWGIGNFAWLDLSFLLLIIYLVCEIKSFFVLYQRAKHIGNEKSYLFRDDAIDCAHEDIFGYRAKAVELSSLLDSVDLSKKSYSVGVTGEWGVGKSSFLSLFAKEQQNRGEIIVQFYPRNAKSVDKIAEDFFAVFAQTLSLYDGNCSSLISRYAHSLNLDGNWEWINNLLSIFKNWNTKQQKTEINAALRSLGRRVYVIVEDLDRLTAPEILEVLKLIDANGNFCKTIFLTAYDKKYVNQVLNAELGYNGSDSYFTDKYFQYEYPMKKQSKESLNRFLDRELVQWAVAVCEDATFQETINHDSWEACRLILENLSTLRNIKRYINLFKSSYLQVWSKVNFLDFVIVTLIRYLDDAAYWYLFNRTLLTYPSTHLITDLSRYILVKDFKDKVPQFPAVPNYDRLLSRLFSEDSHRHTNEYNCICRTVSFDNYFYDVTPEKLYYRELNQLMFTPNLADALADLERYYTDDVLDAKAKSIEEFLTLREPSWVASEERLFRYVCLTIFAAANYITVKISSCLYGFWLKRKYDEYKEENVVRSYKDYKDNVLGAYNKMAEYVPVFVGSLIINRLKKRDKTLENDETYIDTLADDVSIAECAQRKYDERYESDDWSAHTSVELALISSQPNNSLSSTAQEHIKTMMSFHAEDYAKGLLSIEYDSSDSQYTRISMMDYSEVKRIMGGATQLEAWILSIPSDSLRYILHALHQEAMQTNHASIEVAYIDSDNHNDYALVAKMIEDAKELADTVA